MPTDIKLLAAIIDQLPVALFCKDCGDNFSMVLWNEMACRMWGWSKNEILGKNDFEMFPKDQAEFFRQKDIETLNGRQIIVIPEEPIETRHMGIRWLRTIKVPMLDENQQPRYLLGISEDITEQRNRIKELEQHQLRAIQASKMASLGEMAAGIAHEINNPLTIIAGRARQMLDIIDHPDSVDQLKELTRMARSIEETTMRIGKIISGMQSFSRTQEDEVSEKVSINDLVQETLSFCSERFKRNNIDLKIELTEVDLQIECRRVQLSQVILNLLNNAFDAIKNLEERWVSLRVSGGKNYIEIRVMDSGPGIPEDIARRLMEPFFTTKPVGQGTGLGLSLSKSIVEGHGGTLTYNMKSLHTEFVVALPTSSKIKKIGEG